jgi:tetratricopeptide (TPR) repeat protein
MKISIHRKFFYTTVQQKASSLLLFFMLLLLCSGCIKSAQVNRKEKASTNDLSEKEKLKFDYTFHNAGKEKILGNYELAVQLYLQCIKINPKEAAPYYETAGIYDFAGKNELALEYSSKAYKLDPSNAWYALHYAEMLKKNNQIDKSILVYERLIKSNPNKLEYYYDLANSYLATNNLTEALKLYTEVEEKFGQNEELILQKQRLYINLGKVDKAMDETKKLIALVPEETKYLGMLAELLLSQNKEREAMEVFDKIVEKDPNNSFVFLSLSDYYNKKGENEKAFLNMKKAFSSSSLDIDTKVKILLSYYVLTDKNPSLKKEAFELSEILITAHPDEAKAYSIYGDFLYRDKNLEGARTNFRKALNYDKDKFAIWNQILIIDIELNDFASLEKESAEALELFPMQAVLYLYNGVANQQLGNTNKAIEILETGTSLVLDNRELSSQFYSNLGDLYNKAKLFNKSDEAYDKALLIDPSNVFVLNNYSYYLSLRGQHLSKAEKMSKKSNDIAPGNPNFIDTYAWILYKLGKFEDAKLWMDKAFSNNGTSSSVVLEHYGDILYQLKEETKAIEFWKKALENGKGSDLLEKKIADKQLYE